MPTFSETSSPELDEIFATFRKKVFFPSHLSKAQKDLVYKTRHLKTLAADPVIASVGGEEFQLEHINRKTDLPNSMKALLQVLRLMQDKRDWDNLPLFLSGLQRAEMRLSDIRHHTVLASAARAGRLDVVLECARRVSETGFALKSPKLVERLVLKIRSNALASDWEAKETKKALSWVEMVSVMLDDERHGWGGVVTKKDDPRVNPVLLGTLLELSAVRAARHLDGKDGDGKVAEYAGKLLGVPLVLEPADKSPDNSQVLHAANFRLASMIPIIHGMKVAQTVLSPTSEVAKSLQEKESELEKQASQERDFIANSTAENGFRGKASEMYDKIVG